MTELFDRDGGDYWPDGQSCKVISKTVGVAFEAFDRLYYHSPTYEDLMKNSAAVAKALNKVRRIVRTETAE